MMPVNWSRSGFLALFVAALLAVETAPAPSADRGLPAKQLFGAARLPSATEPAVHGSYAKGCLAGGVALPVDGPTWQAMRLSRNRRWGHPDLIALVEKLSREAAQKDGWPGLLVGDIAQPRGGPMLSGHASHQLGLDADIWLTPMPSRLLSEKEREEISATSMLKGNTLHVDPAVWTPARARLLMRAASYPEVERIFVHPGIKKVLCDTWQGDRAALGKIRPYWGHYYHFHIRMKCPSGAEGCKPQGPVPAGTGCDKSLAWWFTDEPWKPAKPQKPEKPKAKPKPVTLADLPPACAVVLDAPSVPSEAAATFGAIPAEATADRAEPAVELPRLAEIPVPVPRPVQ